MKNFTLLLVFLLTLTLGYGQSNQTPFKKNNNSEIAAGSTGLLVFDDAKKYSPESPEAVLKEVYNLPPAITFRLIKEELDNLGFLHQKYQEYHNGIKVEFGTVTFHSKEGNVISLSSEYYPVSDMSAAPSLSKEMAFQKAVSYVGAEHYLWENSSLAKVMDNYKKPEGELVVFPVFSNSINSQNIVEEYTFAYKYDIYATYPISRGNVYIDANTGETILYNAIIKHADNNGFEGKALVTAETEEMFCERLESQKLPMLATGTAATRYSGSQSITTRNISGSYRLRDNTRGDGINTFNSSRQPLYYYTDFTDADNNWTSGEFNNANKDNAALDAHWGAEQTYDYWLNVQGRDSYDNAGASINSWVHFDDVAGGAGYNNAFWNGSVMTYGDGSCGASEGCSGFDALTSIDVAAHEIGHAVMTHTADMVYEKESGAMNEGFSDIWGASVEHYAKGNGSDTSPDAKIWLIGDEIDRRSGSAALRSMSNPQSLGQPDTYGTNDPYWVNVTGCTPSNGNDHCGVHTNSGVLNYWFYLTVVGGNGTNSNGDAYNVSGIGMSKTQTIAYRAEKNYLSSNSTYANARTATIQASTDLYGSCSIETQAVTNAWRAVGVGAAFSGSCTPAIGFLSVTGNTLEATDCSYQDVNVPLIIGLGASQSATVTFSVAGGTATNNVDYEIMTPTVSFPAGSTAQQNMILRVYNDGFTETNETVIIDFTVNPNGGNATANLASDTLTFTITNDDNAPVLSQNITLLDEDFELGGWGGLLDGDGDGHVWISGISGPVYTGITGSYPASETNLTILGSGAGKANANNYFIGPKITIPVGTTNTQFSFGIAGYSTLEHYAVYWTTNIDTAAGINAGINLEDRNTLAGSGQIRTINNTTLAGQTGYFVVRHYNSFANNGLLFFDNVTITASVATSVQTAVNTGTTNDQIDLAGAGTIYTSDASTGNVMLDITNNNSFDYGCTDTSVSRAGTGAQSHNGSTLPNLVMDKNFRVGVDNTASPGSTTVKFYFTSAEIAGWESVTGLSRTQLVAYRTSGNETSALTIGSFGTNITLTGNFTGLDGDYLFGPAAAFADCPGVTTYSSSSWSNGVPTSNMKAIIDQNYSTSIANIDACTLVVNAGKTLTVPDGTYTKVEGNITVNGTLFVANEGSLVQVDDAATVTNNGSITVRKITPFLEPRYFMVMGSPMTAETRIGVYGSSVLVRNHITANFVPNPDVESGDPGAENFADDDGDDWQNYSGIVNAGEGYLVLPQPDLASSGSYTLDYTQGTLNNGQVDYNVTYNGTQNASPNIVGNPYASAIDANVFLSENSMVDAVYFWEHLTTASSSYPGYKVNNYDMGDISMFNSSGGVKAANDMEPGEPTKPNGYISSGQGFGFKATAAGTASFKNYMRVTDNNDTYRRPSTTKNRIWLQVSNETYGLSSGMLISFSDQSIDGYDAKFDAKRLATPLSIYSKLPTGEELAIQGRSTFNTDQEVRLGFVSQIEENQEFKISISAQDGIVWPDVQVFLVDKAENVVHNLTDADYIFKSKEGAQNERFVILFKTTVLGTQENQLQSISIVPNPTTGNVTIVSPKTTINSVEVFDIRGRRLMAVDYNNAQYSIDLSSLQSATYFVKINTTEGSLIKRVVKQ
ncbi:MAG: M4 family metallopeptidase [Aequorivita antarctica]